MKKPGTFYNNLVNTKYCFVTFVQVKLCIKSFTNGRNSKLYSDSRIKQKIKLLLQFRSKTLSSLSRATMASPKKKAKLDDSIDEMLSELEKSRSEVAADVSEYNFNKQRVRLLTGNEGKYIQTLFFPSMKT